MAISNISYSNTFGQWLISTNQVVTEINNLQSNNYTKSAGTLYLNSPSVGLSVGNNALFSGNTTFSGGTAKNLSVYVPSYFYETVSISANTSLTTTGNVFSSGLYSNKIVANTTTSTNVNTTTLNATNGYLNLAQINNVVANTATITTLNSLTFSSNTVTSNSATSYLVYANTVFANRINANNISFGNYTLSLGGNLSTANNFTTTGNFPLQLNVTANSNITLPPGANTLVASGFIKDSDIQAAAGIVDTKLATISTAGKVLNSATTASSSNGASTIVARDSNGDFTTRQITATANVSAAKFIGDGSSLTNLNISSLGSGVIPASLGGTGANNIGKTISIGGSISTGSNVTIANNFVTTGNFPLQLNVTDNSNLTLPPGANTLVASGYIKNADIQAEAGIVDTKLATISTAGKVLNSATTATENNTASAIVARSATGDFSASQVSISRLIVSNTAGTSRNIDFNSSTSARWKLEVDNSTESGSNAGSNFNLNRYTDAGALIDSAVSVNRSTGATTVKALTINGDLVITGNTTTSGASISDAGQFVLRANTGTVASANSEFVVKRNSVDATANNATIRWDNIGNQWELNNVSTNIFYNILTDDSTLISVSKLGTGTPNSSNVLKGDGTWGVVGATITPDNATNFNYNIGLANAVSGMWSTAYVADNKLQFNPSSGALLSTTFVGSGASLTNLNASNVSSGTIATARLGSGTANSTTVLYGDQTWKTVTSGASIANDIDTNANYYPLWAKANTGSPATIYTSSQKYYFNANTGTLNATIFNSLSDQSQKTNVVVVENALDKVININGVEFNWIDNGKKSAGVIAQQLETILPHLVDTDAENGLKSVNYSGIIAYLIESVKELSSRVEQLEKK